MRLPQLRNPIPSRWRDLAIAGSWLVALEIENLTIEHRHGWLVLDVLLVAAMALAAIWRRRAPLTFIAVVLACATVLVASWRHSNVSIAPLYVLLVLPYTVAREGSERAALAGFAVVLVWGIGVDVTTSPALGSYVGTVASICVAGAAGRWLRARRQLNDELARKAKQIEAERESRVRLAVADERTRIARELHALVAANISAMVIQAEAAELLLDGDPRAADEAMAAVEQTGRHALSDMRRVLGVLRHAGESPSLAPLPGVGQVYALVEAARAGGRPIQLTVDGEPGPLPASVDLGLYRILEEALASSVNRAGVRLRFGGAAVELEVLAAGVSGSPPWPTLAMRERTSICGGTVVSDSQAAGRRLLASMPRAFDGVFA